MGLADIVALIWVAPLAGVVTDRSNPLKLLRITQSFMLLNSAVLCALVLTGSATVWMLWLFALADSSFQGFNQPVRMTAINLLASEGRISQAIATNSWLLACEGMQDCRVPIEGRRATGIEPPRGQRGG